MVNRMNRPKRHHWWPLAQSRRWTLDDDKVYVTRKGGSIFRTSPLNIGVESELYTRFLEDGSSDTAVEEWFSHEIDAPIRRTLDFLEDPKNRHSERFFGIPEKARVAEQLGFVIEKRVEKMVMPTEIKTDVAKYISALLVRHPKYLNSLIEFHEDQFTTQRRELAKQAALENMLWLYEKYLKVVAGAAFMIVEPVADSGAEFIYADGGINIEEPWRQTYGIPFDIHAPLTPTLSVQILPSPFRRDPLVANVGKITRQGMARMNRIMVAQAERFVFTRSEPPVSFLVKNWGKPAPKNIGYRFNERGIFETRYEPNRK
jgi:hypothetical protein